MRLPLFLKYIQTLCSRSSITPGICLPATRAQRANKWQVQPTVKRSGTYSLNLDATELFTPTITLALSDAKPFILALCGTLLALK